MIIKVKIFPGSKKAEVIEKKAASPKASEPRSEDSERENVFEVRVKAKPIENRANREAVELLADYLKVNKTSIRLVKGHKSRNKIFECYENCV